GGGEGTVYHLQHAPEYCVKLYHSTPLPAGKQSKLKALAGLPREIRSTVAIPLSLVFANKGAKEATGVILPFIKGHDIYELYNPQGRREHFRKADFGFLVAAARNLAISFKVLHSNGIVMGDVNEQNIKVRHDATLCLMDCDSFQVESGGRRYHCNVGTPLWTPPELQGVALDGLERTPNHDGFGLAQLIFLLLFAGRYPFAGRPLHSEPLPPEAAIAKFAFAFDPTPQVRLLEPPPAAPAFDSLPPALRNLFLRAFREGSQVAGSRPSPNEWIYELQALGGNLKRCPAWPAHLHWKGTAVCPWCKILQTAGVDLFPHQDRIHTQVAATPALHMIWADRLCSLVFDPFQFGPPPSGLQSAAALALENETALWIPSFLQRIPFVQRSVRLGQISTLKSRAALASQHLGSFSTQASTLFLSHAAQAQPIINESRDLSVKLKTLGTNSSEAGKQAETRHYLIELQQYLEKQLIQRAQIPGLGQSRRATLQSYHIITAWDITQAAVENVPGFSVGLSRKLLDWKELHEREFRLRHQPSKTFHGTPTFVAAIQKEAQQLIGRAQQLVADFGDVLARYEGAFVTLQASYHEAFAQCSALEARVRKLSEE
ncbi:MAG: hypothetical protein WCL08_12800, partial [Verrucomicrobiota bacterium]